MDLKTIATGSAAGRPGATTPQTPQAGLQPPAALRTAAVAPAKAAFEKGYAAGATIGKLGESAGIDPFVWGFMGIDKDEQTTPEQFQQMLADPTVIAALPKAAVVRHAEQLKTIEGQILKETDPAKKEQMKTNYDNLYNQVSILRDFIEKGPDEELANSIVKSMGITDPNEAKAAVNRIVSRGKEMSQPQASAQPETPAPTAPAARNGPSTPAAPASRPPASTPTPGNMAELFIKGLIES